MPRSELHIRTAVFLTHVGRGGFELLTLRRRWMTRWWGVWCETTPGAGYWVAAGLTEVEAETIVDMFMSSLPESAPYQAGVG